MALSAAQAYFVANDLATQWRMESIAVQVARDVYAETPQPQNHAARASYANKVLNGPAAYAFIFLLGVANDPAIALNATDTQIYNSLMSIWNAFAGA